MATTEAQRSAIHQLWTRGILQWKLDSAQKELDSHVKAAIAANMSRFVLLCSRRWGKTHYILVLALEAAIQKPNTQIAFISKTKRSAKDIAESVFKKLLVDCPSRIKPTYNRQDFRWSFRNGSSLVFLGCDSGHIEKARGREFNLIMIDEAGFVDDLETIVKEILRPTLLTTRGFMLFASTPPKKPTHPFTGIFRACSGEGGAVVKTIYDNPRLTAADIEKEMAGQGGENSESWQREYLCRFVDSDSNAIIPEWTLEKSKLLIQEIPRPAYCDRYISIDFGFKDKTVALLGWYDFPNSRLVIEQELVLQGDETTTSSLAASIKATMGATWGSEHEWAGKGNLIAISDIDPRLTSDLRAAGLNFRQTERGRGSKEVGVNAIRMLVAESRVIISPKCAFTIKTLFEGAWDKNRKDFVRTEEIGHADAIDALSYMVRSLRLHSMPVAPEQHWQNEHQIYRPPPASPAVQTLGACWGAKPSESLRAQVSSKLGRRRF